jgi:hypothetical protein
MVFLRLDDASFITCPRRNGSERLTVGPPVSERVDLIL